MAAVKCMCTEHKTAAATAPKNLQDHVRHCTKDKTPKVQMTLGQCVRQVPKIAKPDAARVGSGRGSHVGGSGWMRVQKSDPCPSLSRIVVESQL